MTLQGGGEGDCSNRQSAVIWRGEGVWLNRHIIFIVAKKLNLYLTLFTVYVGRRVWLKTSYGGGVAEKVWIP